MPHADSGDSALRGGGGDSGVTLVECLPQADSPDSADSADSMRAGVTLCVLTLL